MTPIISELDESTNEWEAISFDDVYKAIVSDSESIALSVDAAGHEHKGKGPGGGQFVGKGGGGSGMMNDKAPEKQGQEKDEDGWPSVPQSDDDAFTLAERLRESIVEKGSCAQDGDCQVQSAIIVNKYPDAEIWTGDYEQNPEQHHLIIKIGDYFIDATADQFPTGPEAKAFNEEDMEPGGFAEEYGGFRRNPGLERIYRRPAKLSLDDEGHEHKGPGKGGGQFTSKGKSGGTSTKNIGTDGLTR